MLCYVGYMLFMDICSVQGVPSEQNEAATGNIKAEGDAGKELAGKGNNEFPVIIITLFICFLSPQSVVQQTHPAAGF